MKISKVRTTDYRQTGAAARPQPMTGLDHWSRIEAAMQAEHDKAVAGYSRETAFAALSDIGTRPTTAKDPETRWIRHRRAALARKLHAPELIRRSA